MQHSPGRDRNRDGDGRGAGRSPRQALCPILGVGGFLEEGTSKLSKADSTASSCVTRPCLAQGQAHGRQALLFCL